jgi:hypothetical protein
MSLLNNDYIFEKQSSKSINISPNKKIIVVNNSNLFRDFFRVSSYIYKNNKYWISPFWNEMKSFFKVKNTFWKNSKCILYVAYQNNKPVGRIAAIIDTEFIKANKINAGFFGFFECIEDYEIALNLLNESEKWVFENKKSILIGPIDGRVDNGVGFLIKGFNSLPYLLGHYSHKYYIDFIEKFGFKKLKDLVSYNIELDKEIISKKDYNNSIQKSKELGIKIRKFDRFNFKGEMNWWTELLISEFKDHWGYTSISKDDVKNRFGIKQLRWIVDPPLFLVAENDNLPIGFRWSLPDYNLIFSKFNGKFGFFQLLYLLFNKRKINRGRFIIMGIRKDFRSKGIGTLLNYYTILEMKKRGYLRAEYGWIDEENIASRKSAEKIGGDLYKIYRVYEKNIRQINEKID